jgi:hypothetical protein
VAHFSVRAMRWSIAYAMARPMQPHGGFWVKAPISMAGRAHVPCHCWRAYDYDPTGRLFLAHQRGVAYNVAEREWEQRLFPGLQHKGALHTLAEWTPHGLVMLSAAGAFIFDGKTEAWKALPWRGPRAGHCYGDGGSAVYDSTRDCLWIGMNRILKYDFETGTAAVVNRDTGRFPFTREPVYLPEADQVLLMRTRSNPDRVWKPAENAFYDVTLSWPDDKPPSFSWHSAMAYDPKLKLVFLNSMSRKAVYALRFDHKTAPMRKVPAKPAKP